jgi:hypothetical protein
MPALNFSEIAVAHAGTERDQFELFARDFWWLKALKLLKARTEAPMQVET